MSFFELITRNRELDKTVFEEEDGLRISYPELYRRSDQLGQALQQQIGSGNIPILIYQTKNINCIVSTFACIRAGYAFINVDPSFPKDRVKYILKAAGTRLVLAAASISDEDALWFHEQKIDLIRYDWQEQQWSDLGAISKQKVQTLQEMRLAKSKISHIIFTSGTTGAPKGVMVRESSQEHFVKEMARVFGHDSSVRWLSVCPFYFDVFTLDIFVQPYCGSTIFLVPPSIAPHELSLAVEEKIITHLLLISSQVKLLASRFSGIEDRNYDHLQELWYGGESCPVGTLRRMKELVPHLRFAQLYGPSEICNNSTIFKFEEVPEHIEGYMPLGRTIETVDGYLIDANGQLIQQGIGELFLGGPQVMEGYIGDPTLTNKVLIDNPFDKSDTGKIYKTGDYIRIGEDGRYYFQGRKDDLVKVRGNRVSLYEIQEHLIATQGVMDAIVFVKKDEEFLDALVSIVITDKELKRDFVKQQLESQLPRHLQPDYYHMVQKSKIPLNQNGKIDRAKLINQYINN